MGKKCHKVDLSQVGQSNYYTLTSQESHKLIPCLCSIAYTTEKSLSVKYSGHVVNMEYNYSELLTEIQNKVEAFVGQRFNHVLLNKYQSGSEYIGKHRDTKENKVHSVNPQNTYRLIKTLAHHIVEPRGPAHIYNDPL